MEMARTDLAKDRIQGLSFKIVDLPETRNSPRACEMLSLSVCDLEVIVGVWVELL